jgi:hypothetical protein
MASTSTEAKYTIVSIIPSVNYDLGPQTASQTLVLEVSKQTWGDYKLTAPATPIAAEEIL